MLPSVSFQERKEKIKQTDKRESFTQEEVRGPPANTAIQVGTGNLRAGMSEVKCGHHPCPNTPETIDESPKSSPKERGNLTPNSSLHGLADGGLDAQGPRGGKPRSPHAAMLSSSTSDVPAKLFTPCLRRVKSSFLLSPSVREAKQEGVWDYPSSECSRWKKPPWELLLPTWERLEGARAPWPIRRELL